MCSLAACPPASPNRSCSCCWPPALQKPGYAWWETAAVMLTQACLVRVGRGCLGSRVFGREGGQAAAGVSRRCRFQALRPPACAARHSRLRSRLVSLTCPALCACLALAGVPRMPMPCLHSPLAEQQQPDQPPATCAPKRWCSTAGSSSPVGSADGKWHGAGTPEQQAHTPSAASSAVS